MDFPSYIQRKEKYVAMISNYKLRKENYMKKSNLEPLI